MDYGRKRLPYPYSYTVRDVFSNGVSVLLDGEPTRNNCNLVVLELTDERLLQLTSALQAGCDLIYPDQWQEIFDFWAYATHLANTGNFVSCDGVSLMSICDVVADCINTPGGAANIAVNNLIVNSGATTATNIVNLPAQSDLLDCIWGASFASYEIVLDVWLEVKAIVEAAASLAEAVVGVKALFPNVTPTQVEFLEVLNQNTTAGMDTYLNAQATQDDWACALFNCIRSNGTPFEITNDCIDAAFAALNAPPPFDVFGIGDVLGFASDYGTIKSFWERSSDDQCNNDWRTVCGLSCGSPTDDLNNWLDPRIVTISPTPTISPDGKQASWAAGWGAVTITLDNAYCFGAASFTLFRGSTVSEPSNFTFAIDQQTPINEQSGGFGNGGLSVNFGNYVGQQIIILPFDQTDNVALSLGLGQASGVRVVLSSVL